MPQFFENAVMTNAGAELVARSLAEGISINFTSMVVGDGEYTNTERTIESLQRRTALKSMQVNYSFSNIVRSDAAVKLTALITNENPETHEAIVTAGFYINEIGLMAQPSDEETDPILFSVCVTSETRGDYMPAFTGNNPVQIIQGFVTTVSNDAIVSLNKPAGAVALATDIDAIISGSVPVGDTAKLGGVPADNFVQSTDANNIVFGTTEPTELPTGTIYVMYE